MIARFFNLNFRLLTNDDAPQLLALIERNRVRLRDYFPVTSGTITNLGTAYNYTDKQLKQALDKEQYLFVLADDNHDLKGLFFIKNIDWRVPKGELAYFIDTKLEGRGIMTRTMAEIVNYSFHTLGMNKLFLLTGIDNIPSRRIAEKNGFEVEGILRKNFKITSGELVDMVYYGKLRENQDVTAQK